MKKKWSLGNLFHWDESDEDRQDPEESGLTGDQGSAAEGEGAAVSAQDRDLVYLPEVRGALLQIWQYWSMVSTPPALCMTGRQGAAALGIAPEKLEHERVRVMLNLEQDAKKRLHEIEQAGKKENPCLNSRCGVYLSKDRMIAWVFFFPPLGEDGRFDGGALGQALEKAGVTTGIDSGEVVRLLQEQPYFELTPIALGTPPQQGEDGRVVELYSREIPLEVTIDENGMADYRVMNYVRQIEEGAPICDIIPPKEGVPGVQVDGKIVEPRAVRAARPPKGSNTVISEDGLHLIASRAGCLEFSRDAFHVRPLLEIRGDVDYSTGNLDFNGDIHIFGDVRESFEVRATGSVMIDGLVEAATVECDGDLVISRGVVGDHRALLRSKGCIRAKYLENCVVYGGSTIFADCIMTSQIFSDDAVNVTSGRGSIIGGSVTAAHTIRAKMIGAQSGRLTELTLGVLPFVQTELMGIEEDLEGLRKERERLEKDLAYLERTSGQEASSPRLAKARVMKSVLAMKEKKLLSRREELSPRAAELEKCRIECDIVYPVTRLTMLDLGWVAKEVRHHCKIAYDAELGKLKEVI